MSLRTNMKAVAVAGITVALSLSAANSAHAAKRVKWKMQNAWGATVPHLGTSAIRFVNNVKTITENKFQIKNFEPGALVPALECFDAVSKGSIESCWTTPGYHAGKHPAVSFFTAVPFGPGVGEYLAWKWFGGGQELREKLYNKHGMTALDSFCIGPETSGWFKEPVNELAELKGFKMRFFGLGAKVMTKLGVSTQLLAGADIYPALEKGVIDATEFSMPTMDINYGFYQIAKNNYFPGWHQQTSCSELLMNKAKYDELSDNFKAVLQVALNDAIIHTYAETEAKNPDAMQEMQKKHGVTVQRWRDDQLAEFETAWNAVVEEESAKDEYFKEVADQFYAFRKNYAIWGDAQRMKSTYLK
ncbi:MAG: C4-dicarboxylate ABC transporter [Gammaproteobacteria bacterium]|nr:C4-dicarboxylate ABC transporter [Gammaproteobacteria bacterium]